MEQVKQEREYHTENLFETERMKKSMLKRSCGKENTLFSYKILYVGFYSYNSFKPSLRC